MIARTTVARIAACGALAVTLTLAHDGVGAAAAGEIRYRTLFQDPGEVPAADLALEQHAIALIEATPPGEHIGFAFRDFNRRPVADALIAAHRRGVLVDGVIDGGERTRPVVRDLQAAIGADRVVLCGSPTFSVQLVHHERRPAEPAAQQVPHLLAARRRPRGRRAADVDELLRAEPVELLQRHGRDLRRPCAATTRTSSSCMDMKAQVRTDDHYAIRSGDDGRNTMFPSPRRQPDRFTDDTIVDRMDEIDCSEGGIGADPHRQHGVPLGSAS